MAIATMADTLVLGRDVGRNVRAELTNLLYQNTRGMHLAGLTVSLLLIALFRGIEPNHYLVGGWFAYMVMVEIGRGLLSRTFRHRSIDAADGGLWKRRFIIGTFLSALGWGLAGVLLFPSGDLSHQLFLTMVIMGACTVAMPALAANIGGYLAFLLIAATPLTLSLFLELNQTTLTAGIMVCVVIALLARMAFGLHKRLVEQLNIRFAFADIAEELRVEMADRKRAEEQLTLLANYDPLTSLPNRSFFEQKLERAVTRVRSGDSELAVLFVDLDRFKDINDSLGHHTGDEVLKRVAQRLQRTLGERDTVARLSGDEFIMLIEDSEDREEVAALAERILRVIGRPMLLGSTEMRVTASVGITMLAADSPDCKSLLANADTALYRAKHRGRNRFQFFTPDMHEAALQRLARELELRKALQRSELVLHYQPLYDMPSGKLIGVEALVRWHSHEFGLVPPSEFIPLAEDTGLIIPIGEWVLHQACEQAARWRELSKGQFHMAVNLSARQFTVPDLAGTVGRILGETGLPPQALLLEITETVALSNEDNNLDVLRKLRGMGIRIALDDFGTGNSSLGYLKRFPIDVVKLDQSFVRDVAVSMEDAAVARATIRLANALGINVVAEGVENEAQLKWLQDESCSLIQGFLFSQPLDHIECEKLLATPTPVRAAPNRDKMN
ncbi:MAG TPA: EAL domain-containing protein [Gammaproteobacteria bacterium]|nr:EAL domain-containing protein [Gammaproteobacteria bacterium]